MSCGEATHGLKEALHRMDVLCGARGQRPAPLPLYAPAVNINPLIVSLFAGVRIEHTLYEACAPHY